MIRHDDLQYIREKFGKNEEFDGKTIVVTGAAGFLGYYFSWYFSTLPEIGIIPKKVVLLDNFMFGYPKWVDEISQKENVIFKKFDVCVDRYEAILGEDGADYAIHMASIASPIYYRLNPIETIDSGTIGLKGFLEYFYPKEPKGLMYFSSSEIYGDPDVIPTDEEYKGIVSCTGPRSCYDESKRIGEAICAAYAKTYNLPLAVIRPFNDFGPGMRINDQRVPADFAKDVINNRDIVLLSDGRPTRTFCYIADAIYGYLKALLHGQYDYFNIGHKEPEISILEFAEMYKRIGTEIMGYKGNIVQKLSDDREYLVDNPNRRCPVITKAENLLGFKPEITTEQGIYCYFKWLREEGLESCNY